MRNGGPAMLQPLLRFAFPQIVYTATIGATPETIAARLRRSTTPVFFGIGRVSLDAILTTCTSKHIRIRDYVVGPHPHLVRWEARVMRTSRETLLKVTVRGRGRLYFLMLILGAVGGILFLDRWPEALLLCSLLVLGILRDAFLVPSLLRRLDSTVLEWMRASLHPIELDVRGAATSHNSM